jgi:hypothetical protein
MSQNSGICQFCNQRLQNDFKSFERHMFEKHYDIIERYIQHPDDIRQECDKCSESVRNNIDEMFKHQGDKHHDSLPQELKKSYDEWKANGFPKRIMDDD